MKSIVTLSLIAVFLLSAHLGLVVMDHHGHGHVTICPFDLGMANCSQIINPLEFAISHLNAFAKFFSAIPIASLLLALTVFLFGIILDRRLLYSRLELALVSVGDFKNPNISLARQPILRWFSLHENSPSFIGRRLY